jgi:hypothetical protein
MGHSTELPPPENQNHFNLNPKTQNLTSDNPKRSVTKQQQKPSPLLQKRDENPHFYLSSNKE